MVSSCSIYCEFFFILAGFLRRGRYKVIRDLGQRRIAVIVEVSGDEFLPGDYGRCRILIRSLEWKDGE